VHLDAVKNAARVEPSCGCTTHYGEQRPGILEDEHIAVMRNGVRLHKAPILRDKDSHSPLVPRQLVIHREEWGLRLPTLHSAEGYGVRRLRKS
jgi:hypothetical protein